MSCLSIWVSTWVRPHSVRGCFLRMRWTTRCCSPCWEFRRWRVGMAVPLPDGYATEWKLEFKEKPLAWIYVRLVFAATALLTAVFGIGALGQGGRQALVDLEAVVSMAAFLVLFRRYLRGESERLDNGIAYWVRDSAPRCRSCIWMAGCCGLVCASAWNGSFRCASAHPQSTHSRSGNRHLIPAARQT